MNLSVEKLQVKPSRRVKNQEQVSFLNRHVKCNLKLPETVHNFNEISLPFIKHHCDFFINFYPSVLLRYYETIFYFAFLNVFSSYYYYTASSQKMSTFLRCKIFKLYSSAFQLFAQWKKLNSVCIFVLARY